MMATVIELSTRRVIAADPAALVRAARGSMSREAFAAALSPLLSRPAKPGMIRAWESGVPVPRDVIEACQTRRFRTDDPAALAPPPAPAAARPADALGAAAH